MQLFLGLLNIGNIGHKKIEENYGEIATSVEKKFENEYFTLTLKSMAADPAYLIYEYDLFFTDAGMKKVGEIPYNEFDGYGINLNNTLTINDQEIDKLASWTSVEKFTNNQYSIVEVYNIANIKANSLIVSEELSNLYINSSNFNINQEVTSTITFSNNENKVLAKSTLSNGSTLYIEEVANSKFENYVLARIVTQPQTYKEMLNKNKEFMIEDPQFAICDQDDNSINYDFKRLEEFYEKVSDNGQVLENLEYTDNLKDTDLVRMEQVQLLRLGLDDENIPKRLKILPLNRKLYNDRNNNEEKFYKNEDWYELKLGTLDVSEDSTIGGSVNITKVEESEDKIIFYYDRTGFVPSDIDFVLRVKSPKMNYKYSRKAELKNIDGDENKIIYTKDTSTLAGMSLLGHDEFDNLDELEFALFYNVKFDILSSPLEFDWDSNVSEQRGIIENVEFNELPPQDIENTENYEFILSE